MPNPITDIPAPLRSNGPTNATLIPPIVIPVGSPTEIPVIYQRPDGTISHISSVPASVGSGGGDLLAANNLSDVASVPLARSSLGLGTVATLNKDTDISLAANSDSIIATQKATKAYIDSLIVGLLSFKGSTDCSGNPNYPSGLKGDLYLVSVAGKIGGASGKNVDVGDVFICSGNNSGGTEGSVGTSWFALEHNLTGALLAGNNLSELTSQSTARTNLSLGNVDNTSDSAKNSASVTLTNKRITPRVVTVTQAATPAINTDITDIASITGLAQSITSFTTNLTGTPVAGDRLVVQITDDGTPRGIVWGSKFIQSGVALPSSTAVGSILTTTFVWNPANSKWTCIANTTGVLGRATKLATARAINGVAFDGTAPITVPVVPVRQTFSDADVSIATGTTIVEQTGTMSSPRTATLPIASAQTPGAKILIVDVSGTVDSTNKINFAKSGSDTINGTTSTGTFFINSVYGYIVFECDGTSKWTRVG